MLQQLYFMTYSKSRNLHVVSRNETENVKASVTVYDLADTAKTEEVLSLDNELADQLVEGDDFTETISWSDYTAPTPTGGDPGDEQH